MEFYAFFFVHDHENPLVLIEIQVKKNPGLIIRSNKSHNSALCLEYKLHFAVTNYINEIIVMTVRGAGHLPLYHENTTDLNAVSSFHMSLNSSTNALQNIVIKHHANHLYV
jgi:hypothetical protein